MCSKFNATEWEVKIWNFEGIYFEALALQVRSEEAGRSSRPGGLVRPNGFSWWTFRQAAAGSLCFKWGARNVPFREEILWSIGRSDM
jgi:hypothetical protein